MNTEKKNFQTEFGKLLVQRYSRLAPDQASLCDEGYDRAQALGRYLRASRLNSGMSINEVALKARMSSAEVASFEQGLLHPDEIDCIWLWLSSLAKVLGDDIEDYQLLLGMRSVSVPVSGFQKRSSVRMELKRRFLRIAELLATSQRVRLEPAFSLSLVILLFSLSIFAFAIYTVGHDISVATRAARDSMVADLVIYEIGETHAYVPAAQATLMAVEHEAAAQAALTAVAVEFLIDNSESLREIEIDRTTVLRRSIVTPTPETRVVSLEITDTLSVSQRRVVGGEWQGVFGRDEILIPDSPSIFTPALWRGVPRPLPDWLLISTRLLTSCENRGNDSIHVKVLDAAGNPLDGVMVGLDNISNPRDTVYRMPSGSKGPGLVEFVIQEGAEHVVFIIDPDDGIRSDIVGPIHSNFIDEELCLDDGNGNIVFHNSFELIFQRAIPLESLEGRVATPPIVPPDD